jgi:predicted CopG family antitoxin
MPKAEKQIKIAEETRNRLFDEKQGPSDTYDDVINRLLDGHR